MKLSKESIFMCTDDRISFVHDEIDSPNALRLYEGEDIYVLYGTDSIDLAEKVAGKVREKIEEKISGNTGRRAG